MMIVIITTAAATAWQVNLIIKTMKDRSSVPITGASSGIGREIARLLAERGARVFGTARDPQTATPIPGVEMIGMDVTDDDDFGSRSVRMGIENGDEPRLVAEAVFTALTAKSPRLRYPVGKGVMLSRLRLFLPAGLFDRAILKKLQLN